MAALFGLVSGSEVKTLAYWSSKSRLGGSKVSGSDASTGEGSRPSIGSSLRERERGVIL